MATRKRILSRDPICIVCLRTQPLARRRLSTEVDHIVPLSKGGSGDDGNLQGICEEHHKAKTAADGDRPGSSRRTRAIGLDGWPID